MKTKKSPTPDLEEIIPHLIGIWRRFHKLTGPQDKLQTREFRKVVEDVVKIQAGLSSGTDYFADRDLLGAYLLYPWVMHYQEGLSLIGEMPFTPQRVLDLCSGPAPFAFAALRQGASEVIAVDRSAAALQLGAEACGRWGYPLTVRQWTYGKSLPVEGKFDLIILGYCLEELFPASHADFLQQRMQFLNSLMPFLTTRGQILIVESSALEVNHRLLRMREFCVREGIPVQAPCVWRGTCPALSAENSPCYAQRPMEKPYLIKEIQRAADINLSSLKMSYLLLRNPASGQTELPDRKLYRVVSPPVETYHGKRYYLCGTDGGKRLESRIKEHSKETRAFEFLKRGELISFENVMESPHSIDIVKGSTVKVEAACGKPLPSSIVVSSQ